MAEARTVRAGVIFCGKEEGTPFYLYAIIMCLNYASEMSFRKFEF